MPSTVPQTCQACLSQPNMPPTHPPMPNHAALIATPSKSYVPIRSLLHSPHHLCGPGRWPDCGPFGVARHHGRKVGRGSTRSGRSGRGRSGGRSGRGGCERRGDAEEYRQARWRGRGGSGSDSPACRQGRHLGEGGPSCGRGSDSPACRQGRRRHHAGLGEGGASCGRGAAGVAPAQARLTAAALTTTTASSETARG